MGKNGERLLPIDDLGAVIIVLACLGLIALLTYLGKDTTALVGVLQMIVGFIFGKNTRKGRN